MKQLEAIERRNHHVSLAKDMSRFVIRLGSLARRLHAKSPEDPQLEEATHILKMLAKGVAHQVELAQLYNSFSKEVPAKVLTERLK